MDQSLIEWSAPEFDPSPQHARVVFGLLALFAVIIAYALFENSPIMAITFVLLGTVTYLHSQDSPRNITCSIRQGYIQMERNQYPLENIDSFWIAYSHEEKRLILRVRGVLVSSVRIPLGDADPNRIKEQLSAFGIREQEYSPSVIDTLSDFLHI